LLISEFTTSATQSENLNLQSRSLNIILDESLELLDATLIESNILINKNYNQTDLFVFVDYDKMVNAFYHLIENAIGANASEINIDIIHENENAIITIKDNGEGISTHNKERIFEPFFTTKQKNIGLGLTHANKTISNQNGKIELESTSGKYTTFIISLPTTEQSNHWN
jgi:signal transduction histidine kinase